ncbi:MAG: endonuclease V [Deltaproteobacteria bacterium]|nr:endonuclease V [Deltaproteobacteria bacterium]
MVKHPWNVTIDEACTIQNSLKDRIITYDAFDIIKHVGGADVAYEVSGNRACCVITVFSYPSLEIMSCSCFCGDICFAYIPGLFAFREGPLIEKAFEGLDVIPDLLLIDGHGLCHPRGIGIATHMGVFLDVPTIGCAKNHLFGSHREPGSLRGDRACIYSERKTIGCVLRTRDNIKPVFISQGHRVSLKTSVEICLNCSKGYRIPEPLRMAHILARRII